MHLVGINVVCFTAEIYIHKIATKVGGSSRPLVPYHPTGYATVIWF